MNPERGITLLKQHLKHFTFPALESLEGGPEAPGERERKEKLAAIQNQQVDAYVNFIVQCITTSGMCVIAADAPQLYVQRDRESGGRIKALNAHITTLAEDIRDSWAEVGSSPSSLPAAKMLVIVGAAHTNSKNSAAAAGAAPGPGLAHVAGIVQRLRKRDSHYRVSELVFVSASSLELHAQLASIKRPVYVIEPSPTA